MSTLTHDWLTRQEAAEYLRISTITVDRLIQRGDIKSTKVGRNVRISAVSLERYLNGK